ncbi:MAG: Phosphoribosylglycinamide formyltransferase [Methanomicrobiales archaeon 53_19]|jgi:phosphoribosylglycinamide formyltransferase-1|uniref:phosphoribosylglycinamide formyltransferase n=1 Tax=Methanocalculus sp. TaxID=2004547 RepID=UPI000747DEF9|nr:phosphoribosylglycinamide formyltransferase [Methanocalculus sp.]KUK69756.1 MAG: Phosphoribosylglycinamide formyltransferase [Methanocalculus sp. 52_23]KUL04833.1 MAG: Phosphoribosylglycinamide formyltransferase [Methanomicrobiales archaeon 53_19]HIJ06080.1 phosphoribosylglycinamide formyltransferase [Methanocalculus sp.]
MKRIVVLASGRGSNFLAVASAIQRGMIKGRCVGLIVDRRGTQASVRAEEYGIPVYTIDYSGFPGKAAYEEELQRTLGSLAPDLIVLAGYMKILGSSIIREYTDRIVNIHPSLLPSFPGLDAQGQALEYGVKVSGCTVHFVDEGTDSGPVILQRAVPVLDNDDPGTLAERILFEEHIALPEAVSLFCQDRLRILGRTVIRLDEQSGRI